MRRKMEKLAKQICESLNGIMYFTENPINQNGTEGKYFLCFYGTNKIKFAWNSQEQAIEEMMGIIQEGKIYEGDGYYLLK